MSQPAAPSAIYQRDIKTAGWPSVAVVMPVRNEEAGLAEAVESILTQEYPRPYTICLAVGPSEDGTRAVAERLATEREAVQVVDNPSGLTPAALNAAIAATDSDVVVRVDGHSVLSDDYIRVAIETMIDTGACNVGGIQKAVGRSPFEKAVAAAMTSRIGTGGARFHVGGRPGPVDTVYLGVFDRAAGDAVGWFDTDLVRNQDYELNIRLRAAGGVVWFTPELSVEYRPRSTWGGLARQYFEYGYWKARVVAMHPSSLRARQAIPAGLPFVLAASILVAPWKRAALFVPAAYAALLTLGAPSTRRLRTAAVLAVQQLSWGIGFAKGVARLLRSGRVGR